MSLAFRCEICDVDPHWRIVRIGDVVITWACDSHLVSACEGLQRDFEITELVITDSHKRSEWASISRSLEEIAKTTTEERHL